MTKAAAWALAAEGADVAICARGEEALRETEREPRAIGEGTMLVCQAELASATDVERSIAHTIEAFGAIDILVCKHGHTPGPHEAGLSFTDAEWEVVPTGGQCR